MTRIKEINLRSNPQLQSQSQSSQRGGKRAIEEESDDDYGEGPSTQRIKVDEASSQSQNVDRDSEVYIHI